MPKPVTSDVRIEAVIDELLMEIQATSSEGEKQASDELTRSRFRHTRLAAKRVCLLRLNPPPVAPANVVAFRPRQAA